MKTVIASEYVTCNSNVQTGGGTDVTEPLQKILDGAKNGGLHLIVDGAVLIHGLTVHSNTIIECSNSDCGFFMADHANRPIFVNSEPSLRQRNTKNISFIGGTYNHNCTKQAHHASVEEFPIPDANLYIDASDSHAIFLMEFYGIENFRISGVTFLNQRTYAMTLGNFRNAVIEDTVLEKAEHVHPSNQDGLHFLGPGRFLTLRNIRGCTNDDFINIGPDELDGVSSITDVLMDGICFDNTCQGIRMLSRGTGLLDRVTVKNVTGTYRTFGFSINPFFHGTTFGQYGDLYFENIHLRQIEATYNYTPLTFFQVGGDVRCITLKNIRFHAPVRNSLVFDFGRPFFFRPSALTEGEIDYGDVYFDQEWMPETVRPKIGTCIIDGLTVINDEKSDHTEIMELRYAIDNFVAKNIQVFRSEQAETSGNLIRMEKEATVKNMILEDIFAEKLDHILKADERHTIAYLHENNVTLRNGKKPFDIEKAKVGF